MRDFAPSFDYVFFRISHIVKLYSKWIYLILKCYDGFCAAIYSFLLIILIVQISCHVSVGVCYRYGRLEIIFSSRSSVYFMSALAYSSVGCCIHIPFQIFIISGILQFIAKVNLIKASFRRYLHYEVRLVCRYPNDFLGE